MYPSQKKGRGLDQGKPSTPLPLLKLGHITSQFHCPTINTLLKPKITPCYGQNELRQTWSWKPSKTFYAKNSSSAIRIKEKSAAKRLENWSSHFKILLGKYARLLDNIFLPSTKISDQLDWYYSWWQEKISLLLLNYMIKWSWTAWFFMLSHCSEQSKWFRRGKSTLNQILCLCRIIESYRAWVSELT